MIVNSIVTLWYIYGAFIDDEWTLGQGYLSLAQTIYVLYK